MKKNRYNYINLIVILLVVIAASTSGLLVFLSKDNFTAQAITTMTAVIGAFAIWFQMQKGKKLNEGEFIVKLNQQFLENNNIYSLFLKLEKFERTDKSANPFTEDDITKVASYMTFFEVMYLLISRNIIKLHMIDDLFAYQFFILLNNPYIQELELLPCQDYYMDVYRLASLWRKHRLKNHQQLLNDDLCILKKLKPELLAEISQ